MEENNDLRALSFRCSKELNRKLWVLFGAERYSSFQDAMANVFDEMLVVARRSPRRLRTPVYLGDPGLSSRITVRVPAKICRAVVAEAKRRGQSLSAFLRLLAIYDFDLRWRLLSPEEMPVLRKETFLRRLRIA